MRKFLILFLFYFMGIYFGHAGDSDTRQRDLILKKYPFSAEKSIGPQIENWIESSKCNVSVAIVIPPRLPSTDGPEDIWGQCPNVPPLFLGSRHGVGEIYFRVRSLRDLLLKCCPDPVTEEKIFSLAADVFFECKNRHPKKVNDHGWVFLKNTSELPNGTTLSEKNILNKMFSEKTNEKTICGMRLWMLDVIGGKMEERVQNVICWELVITDWKEYFNTKVFLGVPDAKF